MQDITAAYSNTHGKPVQQVLLLTAQVIALDRYGNPHTCRALLDSGSQINFISESMLDRLRVPKEKTNILVNGVSNIKSKVQHKACVQVCSKYSNFKFNLDCLVTREVTGILPAYEIDVASWNIPSGTQLADSSFYKPGQIDLLIGMEWFDDLIKSDRVKLFKNSPTLIDSQLGWLIGGKVNSESVSGSIFQSHTVTLSTKQLSQQIHYFENLENVVTKQYVPIKTDECKAYSQSTFCPNSRKFNIMVSKLGKQPEVNRQYDKFREKYVLLEHCNEINLKPDASGILKWQHLMQNFKFEEKNDKQFGTCFMYNEDTLQVTHK
ncbi:uncharacterized protein LOC129766289 [Toxorhynchites rutilus septentrionalis]|uniref:uncharacterized protein LOC129766289 n=1 Tax=Toxorhynchites rutilus septentrionalis TaxID=329112 RepID=UPI00247A09EC|nr:uncharacterized protein LOC129766289 [Toxorhynchites rutilus septentrionalis]